MTNILLKVDLTSFGKRIALFAIFENYTRLFNINCFMFIAPCSLYGCELWLSTNHDIDGLCVTCRKNLRTIWNLPFCTHSRLLPLTSKCLFLLDEISRRSLNFIRICFLHDYPLIRSVNCSMWCVVRSRPVNSRPQYFI
jgi:hypothetical protein